MGVGGGVQRIEVAEWETSVFGGAEFGVVGTYERLHGTVFGELCRERAPASRSGYRRLLFDSCQTPAGRQAKIS